MIGLSRSSKLFVNNNDRKLLIRTDITHHRPGYLHQTQKKHGWLVFFAIGYTMSSSLPQHVYVMFHNYCCRHLIVHTFYLPPLSQKIRENSKNGRKSLEKKHVRLKGWTDTFKQMGLSKREKKTVSNFKKVLINRTGNLKRNLKLFFYWLERLFLILYKENTVFNVS